MAESVNVSVFRPPASDQKQSGTSNKDKRSSWNGGIDQLNTAARRQAGGAASTANTSAAVTSMNASSPTQAGNAPLKRTKPAIPYVSFHLTHG